MALSEVVASAKPSQCSSNLNSLFISTDQIFQTYCQFIPLTAPYCDNQGRQIELGKNDRNELLGRVIEKGGIELIIPSNRIKNPINPKESPEKLLERLERVPLRNWDLALDIHTWSLTIWPLLLAAGKDWPNHPLDTGKGRETREIRIQGSPLRYISEERLMRMIHDRKAHREHPRQYVPKPGDPNAWVDEKRGFEIHIDRRGEGNDPNQPDHVDMTMSVKKYRELRDKAISSFKAKEEEVKEKIGKGILSQKEGDKQIYELRKQTTAQFKKHDDYRAKWRFVYGQERPKNPPPGFIKSGPSNKSGPGQTGSSSKGGNPSSRQFQQTLQQTKLTSSYNSTNRNNPIPNKSGMGDIGGVACSTKYIEGLFDTPESLFEDDHYFCVTDCKGNVPFTNEELKQILRELAIGIYVHGTIPFFSLHFRQGSADLFPVIHPVYENTLVGRVISMLDYFMKGYLNGGVFSEAFVDQWHKDPSWERKSDSALQELIDFEEYCKAHLDREDQEYISARSLQIQHGILLELFGARGDILKLLGDRIATMLTEQSTSLFEFEGFGNSFRIIAKQNSFQKNGNLFVIDSDFDVLYTIKSSPGYKGELTGHLRKTEEESPQHQALVAIYEIMRRRIHDHMVKMPLCQKYFSMLGVINFFSSYFSTLKKYRKIPVLSVFEMEKIAGCPPLFPHIPLSSLGKEGLQLNLRECIREFFPHFLTKEYFSKLFRHLVLQKGNLNKREKFDPAGYKQIVSLLSRYLERHICASASKSFSRYIKNNKKSIKLNEFTDNQAASLLNTIGSSAYLVLSIFLNE